MEEFRDRITPLRTFFESAREAAYPPVIVITREFTTNSKLIELVDRRDGAAGTLIDAAALDDYDAIAAVAVPDASAYLVTGIDTGWATRGERPQDALETIAARGRTPLTIEEGLALLTHFPDVIAKNEGFSLAGSTRGDRRVPALWIAKNKPKLGWCFMGAPHSWLGTASCAARISA